MLKAALKRRIAFLFAASLAVGCGGEGESASPPIAPIPPAPSSDVIPRLANGPHLGFIDGFESLTEAQRTAADQYRASAIQQGMSIGRIQLDWAELEPTPSQYDRDALRQSLGASKYDNLSLMVLISTLDSDGFTLPADLLNADGTNLRDGLSLESPEVRSRFNGFLEFLLPELEAFNVWGLSLGNEPEANFDALDIEGEAANFFVNALQDGRAIDDNIALTVTLTSNADGAYPDFVSTLLPELDFALLNYYCLSEELFVSAPADWEDNFDRLKTVYSEKDIFFQELGCPVGYAEAMLNDAGNPTIGGSESIQTAFFNAAFDRIESDDQFRGGTIFQLYDWSSELTRLLSDPLLNSENTEIRAFGARFEEWLRTVGLCNFETTQCRPAWDAFLDAATETQRIRNELSQ